MSILSFFRDNAAWLSAGALLTFLSSFGQTFFISIFAGEIRESFELTHGEWGGIYTIATAASAIVMVWAGALCDLFRVRVLAPVILAGLAAACLSMALNPVWWGLFGVVFVLRFTGQGMASHIALVAMSRWFVSTRGKAISLATLGFAIGEAILPLIFVGLMTVYDWRLLWAVAAILAILGIPTLLSLLKSERTPQAIAETNQSTGMMDRQWRRKDALSHWLFWFMIPALLGPPAFGTAFFFHQVYYAGIKGVSHVELVAMFPLYTVIGIAAMVGSGWALDRFGTARILPFTQLPAIVAFLLFAYADTSLGLLAGFMFFGLTIGFTATVPAAFWAEFYGTSHIGSIKAMAAAIMVLGSAIGPGLTGYGIDIGLTLSQQYVLVAVFFLFATVLMALGIGRARPLLSHAL